MDVWINGEHRELTDRASVADALATLDLPPRGVAVSLDGRLVRRAAWRTTPLHTAARVEVLMAVPSLDSAA